MVKKACLPIHLLVEQAKIAGIGSKRYRNSDFRTHMFSSSQFLSGFIYFILWVHIEASYFENNNDDQLYGSAEQKSKEADQPADGQG